MSTMGKWAELASQNERLVLPSDQSSEHTGGTVSTADRQSPAMSWDDTWSLDDEGPISPSSPMSIPQLGVAYWVKSRIIKVVPGSPADKAKLQPQDEIRGLRIRESGKTPDAVNWSQWVVRNC